MPGKCLRSRIAQGKDIVDEILEEGGSLLLLIHRLNGLASFYNFIQAKPLGNQMFAAVPD